MTLPILFAIGAGLLIGLSRQINGRLSLSTSAMIASFWNHIVGFVFLTVIGLVFGGLYSPDVVNAPWYAYMAGTLGVIFVASGSWLIAKIGAINTALLVIAGQMIGGIALDLLKGLPITYWASVLGIVLIMGGVLLTQRR
jgi:transporter family-2 protein